MASPAVVLRRSTVGRREAAYGWTWDGKNDAGTRVLGGSYLVRHRYVDVFGNTSSHDVPVTVSSKRLYFTTTSKTLYGYKTYDRGAWGSKASTRVSGTSLILKSGSGHANAMYRFSLVTATVYKSVRFEVLGKSANGRKVDMWTWNAANGDWDAFRRIGPGYAWWKAPTADGWAHVVGGKAYGQVEAFNTAGSSTWIIYKVRLTYTYGVLK